MKRTGATLAVHALEELGVEHTFGIPRVHTTPRWTKPNPSPRRAAR